MKAVDPHLQILGGYGLFLKQEWLLDTEHSAPCFIPIDEWSGELVPRTTKDMDIGIDLATLASTESQQSIQELIARSGYTYSKDKKCWGLNKAVTDQNAASDEIELEFHSSAPGLEWEGILKADRIRTKPHKSLGFGIHGRTNPELVAFNRFFSFTWDGLEISIPNILTAAMMKLVAFEDRLTSYQQEPAKEYQREQAIKHARDVFRIVAMSTESELVGLPSTIDAIRRDGVYTQCQAIIQKYFSLSSQEGYAFAQSYWREDQITLITGQLVEWFRSV